MSSVRFWLSCHEVEEMPNGHWSYQLLFLSRFQVAKGATVRKLLSLYTLQAELAPVFLACNPWKLQSGVINPRHLVVPHLPARVSIFNTGATPSLPPSLPACLPVWLLSLSVCLRASLPPSLPACLFLPSFRPSFLPSFSFPFLPVPSHSFPFLPLPSHSYRSFPFLPIPSRSFRFLPVPSFSFSFPFLFLSCPVLSFPSFLPSFTRCHHSRHLPSSFCPVE